MQTDPIGYEDQMNLYAYVGNDPLTYIDPTGKAGVVVLAACANSPAAAFGCAIVAAIFGKASLDNIFKSEGSEEEESEDSEIIYNPEDWDNVIYGDKDAARPYCPLEDCGNNQENDDNNKDNKEVESDKSKKGADYKPMKDGHKTNKRKSNESKHQEGDSRSSRDKGNERGDRYRKRYR